MALLEGEVLDHYELRRLVGKGGMANVYEALDLQIHKKVAVKVFKREDEELLSRFIREAQVMASLRHEHLVPIMDSGQCQLVSALRYYIVMPFFEGGTLRLRVRFFERVTANSFFNLLYVLSSCNNGIRLFMVLS